MHSSNTPLRRHARRQVGRLALEALEARETPAAGDLDLGFSGDGLAQFGFNFGPGNNNDLIHDAALQADGKIVLVGSVESTNGNRDFAVFRLNPDGTPDTTFSGDGLQTVGFDSYLSSTSPPTNDTANAVAILADGRIVVAGQSREVTAGDDDFAVAVLLPNGTIDTSFGFSGRVEIEPDIGTSAFGDQQDVATDVVVQANGRVVVVGNVTGDDGRGTSIAAVRLNPSGTRLGAVDTSYGTDGTALVRFDFGDTRSEFVTAAAVQADGKLVLVGSIDSTDTGDFDVAVIRLDTTGALDPAFDGNGLRRVRLNFGGGNNEAAGRVAVQPDGQIVVSAGAQAPTGFALAVVRLTPGGAPDTTFGTGGVRRIDLDLEDDPIEEGFVPLALQPDGKILVAGTVSAAGGNNDFVVTRLNADGSTDTGFGVAGSRGVNFPQAAGDDGAVTALLVQPDGKVVLAGYVDTAATSNDFAVARLEGAPRPLLAVSGRADGSAVVFTTTAGRVDASPVATLAPFGAVATSVRTAVGDVNGDGTPDAVLVTGPGTPIRVAVVSGADNSTLLVAPFDPFGGDFPGGGYVAAADLDRDGRAEFVVTPDQGGGPRVSVFSLNPDGSRTTRANFLGIDDPNFRGGARAAVGDVNNDGTPDVVVAAGFGGGPRTAIFTGQSVLAGSPTRLVADFFAFPGADAVNLRNGSFVSAGDVTGDGFADLVFGGGPGGAPRVFILSGAQVSAGDVAGAQASPVANFFVAGDLTDRGGARVAVTNIDGDGRADVAVGSGSGRPARARVYLGKDFTGGGEPTAFQDLDPFGGAVLADGVFVG